MHADSRASIRTEHAIRSHRHRRSVADDLLGRALAPKQARDALQSLLNLFEIAPVNRPVLEQALRSAITDFEDAVLEQAGRLVAVDAITTRNVKDFRKSTVTILEPRELLSTVETMTSANKPNGE